MPSSLPPVTFTLVRLMAPVEVRFMPGPEDVWIVPPSQFAAVVLQLAVPLPVIVKVPAPVVLRMMPVPAPFDEIFRKVTPDPPIVVLVMFSAVVVGAVVLPMVFVPVTFSVLPLPAPAVAVKTAAVPLRATPPLKFIVVFVLPLNRMPVPVSVMAPVKATVPPV